MINFFDTLYSAIPIRSDFWDRIRIYSALRFATRTMANALLPVYFKLTAYKAKYALQKSENKNEQLIVSLTSFPARINNLWLVIESLLRQTHKPDMIILWLSKEQFSSLESLPKSLLNLQKRGLKIELQDEDLRSHKKYYYTRKAYPNSTIVTVDDDIFYRSNLIKSLLTFHRKDSNAIIASYVCKIGREGSTILPYSKWDKSSLFKGSIKDDDLFFGSGGGTLFPAESLPSEALNKEVFMAICKNADDVWLNAMVRLNDRPIIKTDYYSNILPVQNRENITLASKNIESGNDDQIATVREYCRNNFKKDPFDLK